ncbi:MAG: hypothetical protein IIC53_16480 [Proteobacteria bacterium]|nr:hypothetical protein [Pseudomonadota bacterium]
MDQTVSNAAKLNYMLGGKVTLPITIMTRFGAGARLGAQHSQSFYSIFTHIPGLKVVVPSDAYTTKGLLISAIRDDDPVVICDNTRSLNNTSEVPEEPYTLPRGKARIVREGKDVTLVGVSAMTRVCLEAAESLTADGIDAEVLDLLSLSPLDEDAILSSVKKTNRIVIVDEDTPRCGVAVDIAALVASDAFVPSADGLVTASEAGATAVIQPGGSKRDDEVIAAADEAGVAMVFTGMRHFRH